MEETKIIYHIDDEDTPYLIKLPIPADRVTLGDLKNALNRPNYKFFFKSMDADFGVVKEEIVDDEVRLPCFNGRVVSWLVPADSSASDTQSQCADPQSVDPARLPSERVGGIGDSRPPSFHANPASLVGRDNCDTCTETESIMSSRREPGLRHSHSTSSTESKSSSTRNARLSDREKLLRHSYSTNSTLSRRHVDSRQHHSDSNSTLSRQLIDTNSTLSRLHHSDTISDRSYRNPGHHSDTMSDRSYRSHHSRHSDRHSNHRHSDARNHHSDARNHHSEARSHHSDTRSHHSDARSHHSDSGPRLNGHTKLERLRERDPRNLYESSTILSSDIDSFFDTEEDTASRFSSQTETTARSSKYGRYRRRRRKHRLPPISRASSFSSITDSTMSLNIITVTLNMDTVNFLGISIVGQSNKGGDGGIYVGSIMKGGAVAQDRRIEPGDMILEVNGISFENMSNDDAVRTLREAVQTPGPITLVVAKCWDPNPKGYFTVPRQEPVRPIDPSAWVEHTTAMRGEWGGMRGPGSTLSNITSTSSSITSSIPEAERFDDLNLTVNTDMASVVKAMAQPDSGLEIRDRMWLKITIPNAFIGSDLVDWLYSHVDGFTDRRDARKYACNLLKVGCIRHTVNKVTFSEQCYYIFGDLHGPPQYPDLTALSLEDVDSVSEADRDTLAPLPPPAWTNYMPQNLSYVPPYSYTSTDTASFVDSFAGGGSGLIAPTPLPPPPGIPPENCAGSVHSGSTANPDCTCILSTYNHLRKLWETKDKQTPETTAVASTSVCPSHGVVGTSTLTNYGELHVSSGSSTSGSNPDNPDKGERKNASPGISQNSDTETGSHHSMRRITPSEKSLPIQQRSILSTTQDVGGSRQSFRMAMGNPYNSNYYVLDNHL